MMPQVAFNADVKQAMLAELAIHREADKIIKGVYWERGKGCAVGCTLESYKRATELKSISHDQHALYSGFLGEGGHMLGRLEDLIFEGLDNGHAQAWPERFLSAIPPGADLSRVGWQFLHWLLTDEAVNPGINHPKIKAAVQQCAAVLLPLTKGDQVDRGAAESAAAAASAAARASYQRMADKLVSLLSQATVDRGA